MTHCCISLFCPQALVRSAGRIIARGRAPPLPCYCALGWPVSPGRNKSNTRIKITRNSLKQYGCLRPNGDRLLCPRHDIFPPLPHIFSSALQSYRFLLIMNVCEHELLEEARLFTAHSCFHKQRTKYQFL